MTIIDNRDLEEDDSKKKNLMKNIIKIIAVLIIFLLILMVYMWIENSKVIKFSIDGKRQNNIENDLILKDDKGKIVEENNQIFFSVRKLATLFNYQFYNSEYKRKSEDKTKCQVKVNNIYTSYISGSNKVYKAITVDENSDENNNTTSSNNITNTTNSSTNNSSNSDEIEMIEDESQTEFEYFTVNDNVKFVNDEIYASSEAIELGFDVSMSYNTKNNTIDIYSSDYLEQLAQNRREDVVPSSDYDYVNKRLLKYGMTIVKDNSGNLGVGSYTNKDMLTTYIASCRYSSIRFNEGARTLDVVNADNNQKSILYIDLTNQTVVKNVDSKFDDIKEIDNSFKYFLIENKGKYGVVDSDGKTILYPLYEKIGIDEGVYDNIDNKYILNNKYFPVKLDGKWGLYDTSGKKLIDPQFADIGCSKSEKGNPVVIIPNIKENIDGIVFLYNYDKSLYGVYNAKTGDKIAISLNDVYETKENDNDEYYLSYVIDNDHNVVHTINAKNDL